MTAQPPPTSLDFSKSLTSLDIVVQHRNGGEIGSYLEEFIRCFKFCSAEPVLANALVQNLPLAQALRRIEAYLEPQPEPKLRELKVKVQALLVGATQGSMSEDAEQWLK